MGPTEMTVTGGWCLDPLHHWESVFSIGFIDCYWNPLFQMMPVQSGGGCKKTGHLRHSLTLMLFTGQMTGVNWISTSGPSHRPIAVNDNVNVHHGSKCQGSVTGTGINWSLIVYSLTSPFAC